MIESSKLEIKVLETELIKRSKKWNNKITCKII
jgi:hypothetical protein